MSTAHLFETVIRGGFCIGCGACAAVPGSKIAISYTHIGTYQAIPLSPGGASITDAEAVCPFATLSIDEDKLAADLFPDAAPHAQIGRHLATYAGFVAEGKYRTQGSSGGLVTWLAARLLESGAVDGVAHVRPLEPTDRDDRLFAYAISRDLDKIRAGAKSRYYPVEMSGVLSEIAQRPGRYAVVGVPCFIKAIRLMQRQQSVFAERIVFTIGLVCGHLKSAAFAHSLAWQMGIHPTHLRTIDFRYKLLDRPANKYGIRVWARDGAAPVTRPTSELFGCNWGLGLFKYQACDYCDDVFAETADVSLGDAWLREYVSDSRGTNVVIVRTSYIEKALRDGVASGSLHLSEISAELVAQSQTSGLRHRREGLAYRLARGQEGGSWQPTKRVKPDLPLNLGSRAAVYELREKLRSLSHETFRQATKADNIDQLYVGLKALIAAYRKAYQPRNLARRLLNLARSIISAISAR
jgi:coenzyme F420-reducing hydrogenase beta subunit